MSIELVKSIGIVKDTIRVNSACNNLYPKSYESWTYKGSVENIVKNIIGNELSIYPKTKGSFIKYLAKSIKIIAKEYYNDDIVMCYNCIKKNIWYSEKFDDISKKPDERDKKALNNLIYCIENDIKYKTKVEDKKYYIKLDLGYLEKTPNRKGSYRYTYSPIKYFSLSEAIISMIMIGEGKLIEIDN